MYIRMYVFVMKIWRLYRFRNHTIMSAYTYVCTYMCMWRSAYDPLDNVISQTKPDTNWTKVDQPVFPIWWRLTYSFHLLSTIPESVPSLHSRSHTRSCPNNHSLSLLICQREEWRSNSNIKWSRDTQLTRQWAYICTRKAKVRTPMVGHTPFVCLGQIQSRETTSMNVVNWKMAASRMKLVWTQVNDYPIYQKPTCVNFIHAPCITAVLSFEHSDFSLLRSEVPRANGYARLRFGPVSSAQLHSLTNGAQVRM